HAVSAIQEQWATMRGAFVVDPKTAREVSAIPWLTHGSLLTNGTQLLAALRRSPPPTCSECGQAHARLCAGCAKTVKDRELARRAAEEQLERTEREHRRSMFDFEDIQRTRLRPRPKG